MPSFLNLPCFSKFSAIQFPLPHTLLLQRRNNQGFRFKIDVFFVLSCFYSIKRFPASIIPLKGYKGFTNIILFHPFFLNFKPYESVFKGSRSPAAFSPTQIFTCLYTSRGSTLTRVDLSLRTSTTVVVFLNVLSASYSIYVMHVTFCGNSYLT